MESEKKRRDYKSAPSSFRALGLFFPTNDRKKKSKVSFPLRIIQAVLLLPLYSPIYLPESPFSPAIIFIRVGGVVAETPVVSWVRVRRNENCGLSESGWKTSCHFHGVGQLAKTTTTEGKKTKRRIRERSCLCCVCVLHWLLVGDRGSDLSDKRWKAST